MTTLLAKVEELERENEKLRIDKQNLEELLTKLKKYLEKAAA